MSEIIDRFYTPLLIEHGFIRDPDNQQYGALGGSKRNFLCRYLHHHHTGSRILPHRIHGWYDR